MIGVHDIGGYHLGPVDPSHDKAYYHAWEPRVFGLIVVTAIQGDFNWYRFEHFIEQMNPAQYLSVPYYFKWLRPVEKICIENGFFTEDELTARQAEIAAGTPISQENWPAFDSTVADHLSTTAREYASTAEPTKFPDQPQKFKPGDRVRAVMRLSDGLTRSPRYVWGKTGEVISYHGSFTYPDTSAEGLGDTPEPNYAVLFDGADLWGPGAEPGTTLRTDLFESYLEHAPQNAQLSNQSDGGNDRHE